MNDSFNKFLADVDTYVPEPRGEYKDKPLPVREKYWLTLDSHELRKSASGSDILMVNFVLNDDGRAIKIFINYNHSNDKVRNIALARYKELIAVGGLGKDLNAYRYGAFLVKLVPDNFEAPRNYNITKFYEFKAFGPVENSNNEEKLPF